MIVEPLTDDEIGAAILKSGWVLSTKESVREFKGLATALARAIEKKNTREFVEAGHE